MNSEEAHSPGELISHRTGVISLTKAVVDVRHCLRGSPRVGAVTMCTSRVRRREVGQIMGGNLGLIAAWGWRPIGVGAAVSAAALMTGIRGRGSLLGSGTTLSDLFLMSSSLS